MKTELRVQNSSRHDVEVFLTLGLGGIDAKYYITSVKGIFGIDKDDIKGSFFLKPNEMVSYTPPDDWAFRGGITFNFDRDSCPNIKLYPNGINIFEFNIDNYKCSEVYENPFEVLDISCVEGINCQIKATMKGGGEWNADKYHNIPFIMNKEHGQNVGQFGVYPVGCDDCTKKTNPPHPKCGYPCVMIEPEACQLEPICQIQRLATVDNIGGYILVEYLGVL